MKKIFLTAIIILGSILPLFANASQIIVTAGSDKEVFENQSVILDGRAEQLFYPLGYSWSCNGGSLSNPNTAQPVYTAPFVISNTTYICTLTVADSLGNTAQDSTSILVKKVTSGVSLSANPSAGCAPLMNVALTADARGLSTAPNTYFFDCTNDGSWERITSSEKSSFTAYEACNYVSPGIYTAKVRVEGQGKSGENTAQINASDCLSQSTPAPSPDQGFVVKTTASNLSDGTAYSNSIVADPGELVSFSIQLTAKNSAFSNVYLKMDFPKGIAPKGSLKIDGLDFNGSIASPGIFIGNISQNQVKTITFQAQVAKAQEFSFGDTVLVNNATAYNTSSSSSDYSKITVSKKTVAGVATNVPTGLTNNILLDSFLLPLLVTLVLIWLFRARIINFQEWVEKGKSHYRDFKSRKMLKSKIAQIKEKEFLQSITEK